MVHGEGRRLGSWNHWLKVKLTIGYNKLNDWLLRLILLAQQNA